MSIIYSIKSIVKEVNDFFFKSSVFSIGYKEELKDGMTMKKGNVSDANDEFENYKILFKKNIQDFLDVQKIQEAKELLNQYEDIIKVDIDIYSIRGIISIMEGNMDEAEQVLNEGLFLDDENFDLNYNLAYIYEAEEKYLKAYKHYKKALEYCDLEIKNQIIDKVRNLENNEEIIKCKEEQTNLSKLPTISIITFVYNSKEYIHECAESVLNQSFKDFEWVVLDNGCTDGTSDILEEYAKKDKRIKLFKNKVNAFNNIYSKNKNFDGYNDFTNYRKNLKSEYVALLDSDDFLHKEFLKELYIAAKKYNADISAGGTEMFNDENQHLRSKRCPPIFHTNDITKVGDVFKELYGSFRSLWGKLIKTPIYINIFYGNKKSLLNGGDTYLCLDFLKNSRSLVSLNKVLHYYRIRKNSHYQSQVNKDRYLDYLIIYEESKKLLESWDKLNDENLNFITEVLYFSMKDCIDVAVNTINAPFKDRIEVITIIISDKKLRKILNDKGILINLIDEGVNALNIIVKEERKASN